MIKSAKIKDGLYFNVMSIPVIKKQEEIVEENIHQFLIFDRSGSMYGYLDEIIDSAKEYCNKLPEGSTISVGCFSGNDQYQLTIPFVLKKELNAVNIVLDSYRQSLNLTNFIQILEKVNETASKLKDKSALFFFTDGCHNTGGSIKDIESKLLQWNNYRQLSVFVGYGYIDRNVMSKMAAITDGSFIHLSNFKDFRKTLSDFGVSVEDSRPNIEVDFPYINTIPVSISGKSITEYQVVDGKIKYRPSKRDFQGIYFLTTSKIANSEEVEGIDSITSERGMRALAVIYSQKNEANISLELLNYVGDKYLVQLLYNAITPEEFADAENKIRKSVFIPSERFLEGEVKNFLPDPKAFCILDVINALNNDDKIRIYTKDPDFEYKRIGKKREQLDGSKVEYLKDFSLLGSVIMNQERLNLNINTIMNSQVPLDPKNFQRNPFTEDDLKKLRLDKYYPVTTFRQYSIVTDGVVHIKKLVLSDLSKDTINKLGSVLTRRKDKKYVLNLSSLPLLNKTYIVMTSATRLAEAIWQEKLLMDQISTYKFLSKELEVKLGIYEKVEGLSEEAVKFLQEHCYIKGNYYNPPMEAVTENDQYEAYSFSIDIKGFSNVSSSGIIKKIREGKKVTLRESIVEEAYHHANNLLKTLIDDKQRYDYLKIKLGSFKSRLDSVRSYIQGSKFAIILGNRCKMDEFSSRDNMELELAVETLEDNVLKVRFMFNIEKVVVKI